MRLCLVTPGFSASESDWCIPALHHLVRHLTSRHEVTVVALRHPARGRPYGFFGARVLPLGAGRRTGVFRAAMLVRALVAISREHHRAPFDAVHGLWADEAGFIATVAGHRLDIRSVVSVMGGELVRLADIGYGVGLGATGRWLVRRSLAGGDAVTVGSRVLIESVRAIRGERPVELAPLGVDTTLFAPDGERAALDGNPCLLQVASLCPVKNQGLLLEAFARVAALRPGARLHVVGDGPLRYELGSRAADLGLGGRVRFHGAVQHHRLPAIYRAADLHVTSSRFESQGMAVLEAAACGTATVGTAVGVLPELESRDAARTVTVENPDALAATLSDLVEDRDRLRTLGNAAAAAIGASFALAGCTGRFEGICFAGTVPTPAS